MMQLQFEFMVGLQESISNQDRICNALLIAKGQIELLEALLRKTDKRCTLDDATSDLCTPFDGGGKWRGSITLGLFLDGLIDRVGADNSRRPSRNRGLLRIWYLRDEAKAKKRIESLRRRISAKENPQTAATESGQVESTITETTGKES